MLASIVKCSKCMKLCVVKKMEYVGVISSCCKSDIYYEKKDVLI